MTFLMDWIPGFGAALVLTLAGLVLWARLRHRAAKRDSRDKTELFGGQSEMKRGRG